MSAQGQEAVGNEEGRWKHETSRSRKINYDKPAGKGKGRDAESCNEAASS